MSHVPDGKPLVTVAMPIYNAGKYLRLAVLSIIKQTFTNWELLIIDDGSTDGALRCIADIDDARIRILRDGANKGLAARLNECIDSASGKYLARMDQDDVSYPDRFARQIEALQKNPQMDLVATRAIIIDENDQVAGSFPYAMSHEGICARPWLGFYFPHPTWMGKIEWFRKHRYTVPGPYFCEDQELLLRSYRESQFGVLGEVLFAYRISSKTNWRKLSKTRRAVLAVQSRHFARLNMWHFVVLATAVYIAKMGSDLSKRIGGNTRHHKCDIAGDAAILEWHKVLDCLVVEPKAP